MTKGMFRTVYAIAALVLRIAVVGDAGDGSAAVARGIAKVGHIDAIVLTGDNVYPCGVQSPNDAKWSVLQPLSALGVPIYPVLGNHDHCGKPDAQISVAPPPTAAIPPNWRFPAREYAVDFPAAQFRFIDTTPYVRELKPASTFVFNRGSWHVVVGHHPLLSSGYHGYFPRDEHRRMLALLPAMHDVDLYICGHDHHLELIDDKPLMLISGAGSDPVPPLLRHRHTRFVSEERYRGFALLELTATTMSIQFYDASGKARSTRFMYVRP